MIPSFERLINRTMHTSGKTEDGSQQTSGEEKYLFHRFILSGAVPV
jgi:hypothetical protein